MKNPFKQASAPLSDAERALKSWGIKYKKQADGSILVPGDLDISGKGLTELPDLSQVNVSGNFFCDNNQLTSLKGTPQTVGGGFYRRERPAQAQAVGDLMPSTLTILNPSSFSHQASQIPDRTSSLLILTWIISYKGLTELPNLSAVAVGGNINCSDNHVLMTGAVAESFRREVKL